MTETGFGELGSPDLLSPNLRVKAQKRRRVRLSTDGDLEKSTQELLTALRDPPLSQSVALKPLPSIPGIADQPPNTNGKLEGCWPLRQQRNTHKENGKSATDAIKSSHENMENKVGLERCPTFTKSRNLAEDLDITAKKSNLKGNRSLGNVAKEEPALFSDLSDELGFERRTRRRASRRSLKNSESFSGDSILDFDGCRDDANETTKTPRRRSTRRGQNSPAVVTPIEKLTLGDRGSPKTSRRQKMLSFESTSVDAAAADCAKPLSINHPVLAKPSKLRPINDLKLTQSNISTHNQDKPRPRRRQTQECIADSLRQAGRERDYAASDVMSTVSDDIGDVYDPTTIGGRTTRRSKPLRNSHLDKLKGGVLTQEDTSGDDNSVDIFTSPKRHKKRSRRRPEQAENRSRMSGDGDVLPEASRSNAFDSPDKDSCLFESAENELKGNSGLNVARRRAYNRYLPPLTESFNNLK